MIELQEVIGEGSYGTVYKGFIKNAKGSRKGPYAFKVRKVNEELEENQLVNGTIIKRFWREAEYLKKCSHPNIISMLGVSKLPDERQCLILQLLENKLVDWVRVGVTSHELRQILHELLDAVAYMHRTGHCHRDIKPENLMVKKGRAKIIDFGFVRDLHTVEQITRQVVNIQYRAPQIMLGARYSEKVDIWSLGCVFYQLVEGRVPFEGVNQLDCLKTITSKARAIPYRFTNMAHSKFKLSFSNSKKARLEYRQNVPAELQQLISRMLEIDPDDRISAAEACAHPYFQQKLTLSSLNRVKALSKSSPKRPSKTPAKQLSQLKAVSTVRKHLFEAQNKRVLRRVLRIKPFDSCRSSQMRC